MGGLTIVSTPSILLKLMLWREHGEKRLLRARKALDLRTGAGPLTMGFSSGTNTVGLSVFLVHPVATHENDVEHTKQVHCAGPEPKLAGH
jgi:hypothetical protein